jgi:beta-glucosidase
LDYGLHWRCARYRWVMTYRFPASFVFGCSTAAYQIEGAWNADGKGESIWDRFAHTAGRIRSGDTGDIACDHYHRYEADIDLMAQAGMKAYRFSVAWTRILPAGTGAVNAAGLDFYRRIATACRARGITPWACFYHWDLPQALQDRGGWANRDSVAWYTDYVRTVVTALADVIDHWVMFNEPSIFTAVGHLAGMHAPGIADPARYGAAVHHVNLATANGIRAIRAIAPDARVGTVLSFNHVYPATASSADAAAAQRSDAIMNTVFADPLFRGTYPAILLPLLAPHIMPGDMDAMVAKIDFLGINHYTRMPISAAAGSSDDGAAAGGGIGWARPAPGLPVTALGWEIYPQGLYDIVKRVCDDYGPMPIYITENGGAFDDRRAADGSVSDPDRVALLDGYLGALQRAVADGYPVHGYLIWSLLDNFEWSHGSSKRFGIVYTDYATQQRIPKSSYHWYADLIRRSAAD